MSEAFKDISLDDLLAAIKAKTDAAYAEGFADGRKAAVEEIVISVNNVATRVPADIARRFTPTVATGAWPRGSSCEPEAGGVQRPRAEARAPRGLVAKAIAEVLSETPGSRVIQVVERVRAKHPEIAEKSIGNQMRRGEREGTYERVGKYSWYLKGHAPTRSAEQSIWTDSAEDGSL